MRKIFISYVSEDENVAFAIEEGLQHAGHETWVYKHNSPAGNYLENIARALNDSQMMVLVISQNALANPNQVNIEIVRAHEKRITLQPVLLDVTWDELEEKQPAWRLVLGAAIGITWKDEKAPEVIREIVDLLPKPDTVPVPPAPPLPPQPIFLDDGRLNMARFDPMMTQAIPLLPQEAQLLGHDVIGTPHIYSVLVGIPTSLASATLVSLGIDPQSIRTLIRESVRRKDRQVGHRLPGLVKDSFSTNGIASLETASEICAQAGRKVIEEADILSAILNNPEGFTAKVLDQVDHLRDKLISQIQPGVQITPLKAETQMDHPLRLAEETRLILNTAMTDAFTSGFDTIETPHFITAITRMPDCKLARALIKQGLSLEELRLHMSNLMPPVGSMDNLPKQLSWELYSSRMKEVLQAASLDSLKNGDDSIQEVHLAAGMAAAQSSMTMEYLRLLGVDFDRLVEDVKEMPSSASPKGSESAPSQVVTAKQEPFGSSAVVTMLKVAQASAFQYGYRQVETPFVFMALCSQPDSSLMRGLREQGVDPSVMENALRTAMAPAGKAVDTEPVEIDSPNHEILSPRVQNILKIAIDCAGGKMLEDTHLCVGFLKSQGGQTHEFLKSQGVNLSQLLSFVEKEMS